jgi:hypothetical protein
VSEIERYLDELFDQLAGTGAAGRRALLEAEYHLRAVAVDAITRGLSHDQAEHEAVGRFGPPALVARTLRSAGRLNRGVSTAWLLAGLAACGFGVPRCCSAAGSPSGGSTDIQSPRIRVAVTAMKQSRSSSRLPC